MTRRGEGTKTVGLIALVAMLMTGAIQVEAMRERRYPPAADVDTTLYLTSGSTLRHLTVSLNALAADVYWIRTIQYYGGTKRRLEPVQFFVAPPPQIAWSPEYDQLYPLLDLTTSLDPRFKMAYRFGAVFLAESYPSGPGRPDLAVKLLEKGLEAQPDKWEYMEDVGFVHYWYEHNYKAAADAFDKAGQVPGAPWWLRSLAATTLAQGGDRRSSRTMWQAIRESAEIDWLRHDADRRLTQLDALDQIDALQRVVDRYAQQSGQAVDDWPVLVRARVLPAIPVDPAGAPYEISGGRVRMAASSPLWPLPKEPERLAIPGS